MILVPCFPQVQLSSPLVQICSSGKESIPTIKQQMSNQLYDERYKIRKTLEPNSIQNATSFMIIADRFVLESSISTSVFPLTTTRPRPVRYASKILQKNEHKSPSNIVRKVQGYRESNIGSIKTI